MPFNYLRIVENAFELYFSQIWLSHYFWTSKIILLTNFVVVSDGISLEIATKFTENHH